MLIHVWKALPLRAAAPGARASAPPQPQERPATPGAPAGPADKRSADAPAQPQRSTHVTGPPS
jgi:hypothetical protein